MTLDQHHERCRHLAYVLSCAEFDDLYGPGVCQICGRDEAEVFAEHGQRLYIDHIGGVPNWRVRGLLCLRCNTRLRGGAPFSTAAEQYLDQAYWQRLGSTPAEPSPSGLVTVRWGRRLRFDDDGRWHPTYYGRQNNRLTWAQWCNQLGPRILLP